MAKNNGTTIKRVTRKRQTAPKTARKPRLADEAVAEIAGAPVEVAVAVEAPPVVEPVAEPVEEPAVTEEPIVAAAPVVEEPVVIEEPPPPSRAVTALPIPESRRIESTRPEPRFRRVAFVRAMLHRLRRAAERRAAPIGRRLGRRFPRLAALHDTLRRWF